MAIIKITKESRKHLICRAQQRFKCPPEDATYSKDKDIGELKHSYKSARLDLSHLIPIL